MRTGSYSFHSERFRKSYGIFRNRYDVLRDQAAPIVVFHHVLADGSAGLTMLAGLMDGAPD